MRRTTICRSRCAASVAVGATLFLCPVLGAQEGAGLGQVPSSHTVSAGETLWAISQMYYGDPLLWPEVYRLNTAIIEDPHWIYPGEVLSLAPAAALAQAPTGETEVVVQRDPADTVRAAFDDTTMVDTVFAPEPPPDLPESAETLFDTRPSARQRVQTTLSPYANLPYRSVRRGEFYSAGFLTEDEDIPWATVLMGTDQPAITSLEHRGQAQLFGEIALRPSANASYHVGDSLLLAHLQGSMRGWGDVVVPAGIVRVTEVQPLQILGVLIAQFNAPRQTGRFVAMPIEPFRDPGDVRPVPVEQGLQGTILGLRDPQPLVGMQELVFIDRGRRDGIVPGDVFEAFRPAVGQPGTPSTEVVLTLLVVHTREKSATTTIIGVRRGDLEPGTPVRLTRKMPS